MKWCAGWIVLAASALAGCTTHSGVETTPTFTPARLVGDPQALVAPEAPALPQPPPAAPRLVGAKAVYEATRKAMVDPTDASMHGAAWVVEDVDETRIYRVPTCLGRVTTILLPEGEQINKITGGEVEAFLVEASYAGARPSISILPAYPKVDTNIAVSTTGGLYSFQIRVFEHSWTPMIDLRRQEPAALPVSAHLPLPQGQFDRLHMPAPDDGALPAWAPVEAWADAERMVVRFRAPLPVLPGLYAGQKGEQVVNYRVERTGDAIYMITSRRVTEAELRLDDEAVRITSTPPDPRAAGLPARQEAWHAAGQLPEPAADEPLTPLAAFDRLPPGSD